eukprot:9376516-Pyramimonas_sp.AAC.1
MNGLRNGLTCVIPYARYFSRYTDILIQEDIGNNIARGMLQQKLSVPTDKLAEGWKLLQRPSDNCPKGIEI